MYATGKACWSASSTRASTTRIWIWPSNYAIDLDYDPRDDLSRWTRCRTTLPSSTEPKWPASSLDRSRTQSAPSARPPMRRSPRPTCSYGSDVDMTELVNVLSQQSDFAVANNSWGFTSAFADNFQEDYFAGIAEQLEDAATNGRDGLGTAIVMAGRQRQVEYRRREPRRRRQLPQSVELAIRDRRRRPQCAGRRGILLEPRHQCPDLGARASDL